MGIFSTGKGFCMNPGCTNEAVKKGFCSKRCERQAARKAEAAAEKAERKKGTWN